MLIFYPIIGVFTGLIAGLFGMGGGIVIVPALSVILPMEGVSPAISMQVAIATSLAIVILTGLSSTAVNQHKRLVLWDLFLSFLPGTMVGGILGALSAHYLSSNALRIMFGVFILLIALRMLMNVKINEARVLPSRPVLAGFALFISMLCSMLGLSGGSLLVPYMRRYQVAIRNAVATSSACNIPVACAGVLTFMLTSMLAHQSLELPGASMGYVYLPAAMGIAVTSIAFAPLGIRIGQSIRPKSLQRWYGVFLLFVSLKMILQV